MRRSIARTVVLVAGGLLTACPGSGKTVDGGADAGAPRTDAGGIAGMMPAMTR